MPVLRDLACAGPHASGRCRNTPPVRLQSCGARDNLPASIVVITASVVITDSTAVPGQWDRPAGVRLVVSSVGAAGRSTALWRQAAQR